jgi:hypothetical protein
MPACTGMMVVFSSSLNFKVFLGAAVGRAKGATHPTAYYRFALNPDMPSHAPDAQKPTQEKTTRDGERRPCR